MTGRPHRTATAPLARTALPALVAILAALAAGCVRTVQGSVRQLQHRDAEVRFAAARDFPVRDPNARTALPALKEALRDRSPDVRCAAAIALARIERKSEESVPVLIEALRHRRRGLRIRAAAALAGMGDAARPARSALLGVALRDESTEARYCALLALMNTGAPFPALRRLWREPLPAAPSIYQVRVCGRGRSAPPCSWR